MNTRNISSALNSIRSVKQILKKEGVIRHEKTIHCELAEWLIAEYLSGTRAISGNQKGWDIQLENGDKIQVKSHAKARTNASNWTTLSKDPNGAKEIFIVVFSSDYFILEIFRISTKEAYELCNSKKEVTWVQLRKKGKSLNLKNFKKQFPFLFSE